MIYDTRKYLLTKPYKDTMVTGNIEFHRFSRLMNLYFSTRVVPKVKHAKIFPIDILYYEHFCTSVNLHKMLGSKVVKKLSRGKGILVFHFAHEAFHPGNEEAQYDPFKLYILPQLRKLSIPLKNVFFITGDLKTHTLHNDGVEEMNFIGIDIFGELVSTRTSPRVPDSYYSKSIKFNLKKPIDFLYLNGCPRPAKCLLKYHLQEEGLLEKNKAMYSWLHRHQRPDSDSIENMIKRYSIKYREKLTDIMSSVKEINVLDATHTDIGKKQDLFPKDFIDNTCINLIPETSVHEPMFFITEKTYKTILFQHPFILWGNSFMLRYLRSLGYVTFSNIFDESYDSIDLRPTSETHFGLPHSIDYKMEIISHNLKTFRERSVGKEKEVNEILDHNKNLLIYHNPSKVKNIKAMQPLIERAESV